MPDFFSTLQKHINRHPFSSLLTLALIVLVVSSFKPDERMANGKIGVINLDYVIAQSNAGQQLQAKLATFQSQVQAQGEKISQEARNIRQRILDGANSLSEAKLAELQKQYEDKAIEIRRFQDDKQREGEKIKNEGLQKIEQLIGPKVDILVQQEGVDLVLNNQPGVVIWSSETIDLTQALLKLLNE